MKIHLKFNKGEWPHCDKKVGYEVVGMVRTNVGRCQQTVPVVDVFFDDPTLQQAVLQGRHNKIMGVPPVVDNVLQVNADFLTHVFEEVLNHKVESLSFLI